MNIEERNNRIVELIKTKTLVEIGEEFGISRERVRQILWEKGIRKKVPHTFPHKCIGCGVTVAFKRHLKEPRCKSCWYIKRRGHPSKYIHYTDTDLCIRCGKRPPKANWLCKVCRIYVHFLTNAEYRQRAKEKQKIYIRAYNKRPEVKKRRLEKMRARYAADPELRKRYLKRCQKYYYKRKAMLIVKKDLLENQSV